MSKPRSGAKRVGIGLLAGALAVFGIALAPSAGATSNVTTTRLAGSTRYGTAAAIAGNSAFGTPGGAIVATGENFPDALAASALAGSKAPAPIVLTQKDTYTADAKSALGALKSKGVTTVSLVGGTSAVSDSVKNAIAADGFTVTRVAGTDRYETAAAIASASGTPGSIGGNKTALIATGENFPDALAGGPAAYAGHLPILLVHADSIPAATSSAISSLGIKHAVILGGTAVVSDAVKSQLDTATGTASERVAGTNRYGTAAAVGDWEKANLAFPITSVVAATGNNFPDALAAGPLGGQIKAPIVLTASCPAETTAFIQKYASSIATIFISGGTAVIDEATATCLADAAKGSSTGTSVSTRPELQSASIFSTNATDGTTVKYCFDEPVNTTTAASFRVYTSAGAPTAATSALNDLSDSKCVNAVFPGITTASGAAALTLATVDDTPAAVTDNSSPAQTNPIGDAPLGSGGSTTFAAGITSAPDLVSVGGFTPDPVQAGQTQVTFTFDEAAYNTGGGGYNLVRTDGVTVIACTYVSGTGTTAIVVRCPTGAPAPAAGTIARGYVAAGTVTDSATAAGPNLNPLQAADVAATSASPDLVSATLQPDATNGLTKVDRVIYTFDESVTTSISSGNFQVYLANGTTVACGCTNVIRNETNQAQVSVDFADTTLASAVGANVLPGAVTGFASGLPNLSDEEGMANSGTAATSPGKTDGPDLTGVIIAATKDSFGNITGASATFLFDEDLLLASTPTASKFKVYLPSGTGDVFTCTFMLPVGNTAPQTQKMAICGAFSGSPSASTLSQVVLGTVDDGAVTASDAGVSNPEGAEVAAKFGF